MSGSKMSWSMSGLTSQDELVNVWFNQSVLTYWRTFVGVSVAEECCSFEKKKGKTRVLSKHLSTQQPQHQLSWGECLYCSHTLHKDLFIAQSP